MKRGLRILGGYRAGSALFDHMQHVHAHNIRWTAFSLILSPLGGRAETRAMASVCEACKGREVLKPLTQVFYCPNLTRVAFV